MKFSAALLCMIAVLTGSLIGKTNRVVELKLEKALTIRSDDLEDPPVFYHAIKSREKNRILITSFRPCQAVYVFDGSGKLIRKILARGEGPGELRVLYHVQILDDRIIANSMHKVISFDLNGELIDERKLHKKTDFFFFFLDADRYLTNFTERFGTGRPIRHLALVSVNQGKVLASFMRDDSRTDIGVTQIGYQNLFHPDITPDYKFTYLPGKQQVACILSDEITLHLKDLQGRNIRTARIDFQPVRIDPAARDKIINSLKSLKNQPDIYQALKKKIPEKFLPIIDLIPLPADHLAVFLRCGSRETTIRIFNADLEYRCDLKIPDHIKPDIAPVSTIRFYDHGIYLIQNTDDTNSYVEYRITNLNEILSRP